MWLKCLVSVMTHAHKSYLSEFQDGEGFGKESRGLSPEVLIQFENHLKINVRE
jgi:tRNA (cytidine/uridine-2'-O-)-methyltransferase